MSSTLNSISAKTATPPAKITGKRETDSYTLAAADSLLKTTGQWKKWEKIRQTNDALAKNLASLLMERHYFLNQAKSGKKINWEKFNLLTAKLSNKGIHLWDKNALLNSGWEKRNNLNINSYPDPDKTNPVNNQILKSKKPENTKGQIPKNLPFFLYRFLILLEFKF
ncbi:MAG: hypothetical protein RBR53_08430 [Desulforegulaceae bacterium]|nr:hypothetical protein [Desulforegulaceae bacterium]